MASSEYEHEAIVARLVELIALLDRLGYVEEAERAEELLAVIIEIASG